VHFSDDSGDIVSPKLGREAFSNSRGASSSFNLESLQPNFSQLREIDLGARVNVDLRSTLDSQVEESFGFIDASHNSLSFQTRLAGFELPPKYLHETRPSWAVSPAASYPPFWDSSGEHFQETQQMKSSTHIVHDFKDHRRLNTSVKLPQLFDLEDGAKKSCVSLDNMHKELQSTLHQLKVLHAFPPGTKFEDEHSGLVKAILAMTELLASLKDSSNLLNALNPPPTNEISANKLRDLVSQIFFTENVVSGLRSAHDPSGPATSSHFVCSRNNLFTSIRECLSKTRSDWSAQYKQLEDQFLKSSQEIKTIRLEAADAIQRATAQYKDADSVWETTHSQHLITIGNLREQLHNMTLRYSNLQVESKSDQEHQEKELRQQISHLQGQVNALKQVAEKQTFHNAEESRRYEALSVEHDKLLQTLSILPRRDEHNEALSAEKSKLQLVLEQKQADHDLLATKFSNLQSHFNQQQISFQQLVLNTSSFSKEEMIELQVQNSELLAEQQRNHDALVASLRTCSALENENNGLKQYLDEKSFEISAKDDEIRRHELFQLNCAESHSKQLQECTSILLESRTLYLRALPGILQQESQNEDSMEHADLCDLIRSEVTTILERQLNLERTVQELRQRIKALRTQAKVASSKALKDTEDRMCEVENIMNHTVDAIMRQQVLAAVDGAKSQLRDLNVAHEHHYVMGLQDINDCLHKDILETIIRDRPLRARISAIFEISQKSLHANGSCKD
jgi:hypothetical protein